MIERHREVWDFALDHTAGMENWDLKEGDLVQELKSQRPGD